MPQAGFASQPAARGRLTAVRMAQAVGAVATTVLALGWAVVGVGAAPVDGATLTVTPLRVDPEEVVTLTVAGCSETPEISVGESDFLRLIRPEPGPDPETWVTTLEAGLTDWRVDARCGDEELGPVVVDIDNPLIAFTPIGAFVEAPDPPAHVYGSDCPDGTVATVRFDEHVFGRPTDATGEPVTAPIDERGDWQVDTPIYTAYAVVPPPGTPAGTVLREFRVHASCGDVRYPVISYPIQVAVGDASTTTTLAPSTTVPPAVPEPPAASPQSGRPTFTG